jgi:hypothetical protein
MTMIGCSDDAKMMELLDPLRRLPSVPFRASPLEGRPWFRRPVVAVAVAVVGLGLVGVAIADGFGAFRGISAAEGPQTPAALNWARQFQSACAKTLPPDGSIYFPPCHLVLSSARLLSPGSKVYVVMDSRGDLCDSFAFGGQCGPPLDASQPITLGIANTGPIPPGGTLTVGGVALDRVTAVSFTIWGKPVTVPVKDNTYVYERQNSSATDVHCVVAHMADGSTVKPFPEVPCP